MCIVVYFSGPTSFAPIIDMAMTIVEQSGGQYHVLVIIADGQVLIVPVKFFVFMSREETSMNLFRLQEVLTRKMDS